MSPAPLLLLTLLLIPTFALSASYLFKDTTLAFDQTGAVDVKTPLEITIQFRPWNFNLTAADLIYVRLPRFSTSTYTQGVEGGTGGANIALGNVELSPSTYWYGQWTEGSWCASCDNPYNSSLLSLQVRQLNNQPVVREMHTITIFKSNNIKAYCGQKANSPKIMLGTNASGTAVFSSMESTPLVGNGCQDQSSCNLHGTCDYCYNTCSCDKGYGNAAVEVFEHGSVRIDCAERTCPKGKSIRDLPMSSNKAHMDAECSNNGKCDRTVGFCQCFDGWEGLACDRMICPNRCSGHGICASMREQAGMENAFPLGRNVTDRIYGKTPTSRNTTAWDYDSMYGCVCDSNWPVGLEWGEWQAAEWHGPDCSLKRCPMGDDPMTRANETDCKGVVPKGSSEAGKEGNGCVVECSNRGVCQYEEGIGRCKCFQGFLGENCDTMSVYGMEAGEWFDPAWNE